MPHRPDARGQGAARPRTNEQRLDEGGRWGGKRKEVTTRYRTASAVFGALFLTTAATGFSTDVNVAVAIAPAILSIPYFAVALSVMLREGHHPQVPEGHAQ